MYNFMFCWTYVATPFTILMELHPYNIDGKTNKTIPIEQKTILQIDYSENWFSVYI